jgi:hypothetical protein
MAPRQFVLIYSASSSNKLSSLKRRQLAALDASQLAALDGSSSPQQFGKRLIIFGSDCSAAAAIYIIEG